MLLSLTPPERSVPAQGLREAARALETLSDGTPKAWVASFHADSLAPSLDAARELQARVREQLGTLVGLQDASCTVTAGSVRHRGDTVTQILRVKGVARFEKAAADVDLVLRDEALHHFAIHSAAFRKGATWRRLVKETQIAEGAMVLGELLSPPTNDDESLTRVFRSGRILRNARMHAGNATTFLGQPIYTGCIFAERIDEKPGKLRLRYALVGAKRSGLAHVTISTGSFPRTIAAVRFEFDEAR